MKPAERQKRILAILQAMQTEIRVEALAEMLDVSALTIRRDLEELSNRNTIIRTHGGCLAVGRAALESEYHNKVALNFELKRAIGKRAAEMVEPGQTLLLNDGSTTFHLASHLNENGPLSIFTNSIALISVLSNNAEIKLTILGGEYNDQSYSLRGSLIERTLEMLHFDIVFLGADAIDSEGRLMVSGSEEARVTEIMIRSGERKILLADHTKIGKKGLVSFGSLSDFESWITTRPPASGHEVSGRSADELFGPYRGMTEIIIAE